MAAFEEPVGPLADVSELLYVVALHKASLEYREDVSVNAEDISLFLMSRYGVQCSPENVEKFILKDVAGKRNDNLVVQGGDDHNVSAALTRESIAQDISSFASSMFGVSIQAEDLKELMIEETHKSTRIKIEEKMDQVQEKSTSPNIKMTVEDKDSPKMDLVELVAMLLIPEFRKLHILKQKGDDSKTEACENFDFVVNVLVHDLATSLGNSEQLSPEITPSMVRDLFLCFGETTLAQDDELINDMVKAARIGLDKNEKAFLDGSTVAKALTHDIEHYNVETQESITTNYDDVFGNPKKESAGAEVPKDDGISFVAESTAETIDMTAHTYFCRLQMMLNWLFFVFTYFAYIYGEMTPSFSKDCPRFLYMSTWSENKTQVWCSIGMSILDWLIIFGLFSFAGVLFVGIGSIGNNLKHHYIGPTLFSMVFLMFLTIYFPMTYGLIIPDQEPVVFMRLMVLAMGFLTTLLRLRLIVIVIMKNVDVSILPFTSLKSEASIKKASVVKLAKLQEHAFSVHEKLTESSAIRSYFGQALANFSKLDPQFRERFNGDEFRKDFVSGRIVDEDGIFFSGRLLSGNVAQLLLSFAIMGFGFTLTRYVHSNWIPFDERADRVAESLTTVISLVADQTLVQEAVDGCLKVFVLFLLRVLYSLDNAGLLRLDCVLLGTFLQSFCERTPFDDEDDGAFVCSLFTSAPEQLCESMDLIFRPTTPLGKAVPFDEISAAFNTTSLVSPVAREVSQAMSGNIAAQVNHLYPRDRSMVVVPVAFGAGVATLCALIITLLFLPSITATTLKLRAGVIPSVCDPNSKLYFTFHSNSGSYIFGSMFWGIIASSVLVGGIVGFVLFLAMWQVTAHFLMQAVALSIGISVTLLLKWLIKRTFRTSF